MIHWRTKLLGLALACGLAAGCSHPVFLAEKDLQAAADSLPPRLESNTSEFLKPQLEQTATPADVNHADRPPRYLSLEEAFALALENGYTNSRQPGTGTVDDNLASYSGASLNNQSDYVRVIAYNPAITYTALEESLARFDTMWVTSMNWSTVDNLQQGLQSFNNGSSASFASSFIRALPFGGAANVSFQTDYHLLTAPPTGAFGVLNPSYTSRLIFGFETPLWRDFGIEINELLNRTPAITGAAAPPAAAAAFNARGAALTQAPSFTGTGTEGILVARLRLNSQRAEFERNINSLILSVEVAYWKLYQAYGNLWANEEILRVAHKSWMINKAKFDVGTIGPATYGPFLAQYQEFRAERLKALAAVLESERVLRRTLGLRFEDGTRLVPVTPPNMAAYHPSFDLAVKDAMMYRPELTLARENLQAANYNLINQKNFLKPDLRFFAQYSPVGFGTRLDGSGAFIDGTGTERSTNAFRQLASDNFNDWSLGLTLSVPIGYRLEFAAVRSARLGLAQSYYFLKDQEEKARYYLTQHYQALSHWYGRIEMHRAERKAYAEVVEARYKEYVVGKQSIPDFLLDAQRRLVAAQQKEYEAIAEYNNSLARFEFGKGTILHANNVFISDGPLPECAQVRAVDNEKERTRAFVIHEKPRPLANPGLMAQVCGEVTGDPHSIDLSGQDGHKVEPMPQKTPETVPPPKKMPAPPSANPAKSPAPMLDKLPPPSNLSAAPTAPNVTPTGLPAPKTFDVTPANTSAAPQLPNNSPANVAATPKIIDAAPTEVPAMPKITIAAPANDVKTSKTPNAAPAPTADNLNFRREPATRGMVIFDDTSTVSPGTWKSVPTPSAPATGSTVEFRGAPSFPAPPSTGDLPPIPFVPSIPNTTPPQLPRQQ
jgi:outer membrane protein TolC